MSDSTILNTLLDNFNTGKQIPALSLVSNNPELASVVSKLVTARVQPTHDEKGNRNIDIPNISELRNIASKKSDKIDDAETIAQVLPDIELCIQILVSTILSPKDSMTVEINYSAPDNVLPSKISSNIINAIRSHVDHSYRIKPELPKILRNILFERGSHVIAVLPENSVDNLINGSTAITLESINNELYDTRLGNGTLKPLGLLGNPRKSQEEDKMISGISLESYLSYNFNTVNYNPKQTIEENNSVIENPYISVTDNPNALRTPFVKQAITNVKIKNKVGLGVSLENRSNSKVTDKELYKKLYRNNNNNKFTPIVKAKTDSELSRRSIGSPLVMEIPSEAVIPVHLPSDRSKHVGYFVLLDSTGNPLSKDANTDHFGSLSNRLNTQNNTNSGDFMSSLIRRVKSSFGNGATNSPHVEYFTKVYSEMVEADLLSRLKNGLYGSELKLGDTSEISKIMLSRTLQQKQTQLLFLPKELVNYMAFKYDENGMGRSLLEETRILSSLRAITMFSNVMASARNSIGRTNVNIKLDEDDSDPQKTIELTIDQIARSRQASFPVGNVTPIDLVTYLQRAGYQYTYEGHPGLPDVKIDMSETAASNIKPDSEMEESLRKRHIQSFGLTPEMIDAASGAEFATSVANNHILLSRRTSQIQDEFTPQLWSNIKNVIKATPSLMDELIELIINDFEDVKKFFTSDERKDLPKQIDDEVKKLISRDLLDDFLDGVNITLPKPNSTSIKEQVQSFEDYLNLLDKALDFWVSEEVLGQDIVGNLSGKIGPIKQIIRSHYIRQWMAENGIMTELSDIVSTDEDGKPKVSFFDSQKSLINSVMASFSNFIIDNDKNKTNNDKLLESSGVDSQPSSSDTGEGGSDSSSSTDSSGDFNFDTGGDLDSSSTDDSDTSSDKQNKDEAQKDKTNDGGKTVNNSDGGELDELS